MPGRSYVGRMVILVCGEDATEICKTNGEVSSSPRAFMTSHYEKNPDNGKWCHKHVGHRSAACSHSQGIRAVLTIDYLSALCGLEKMNLPGVNLG